MKDNLWDLRRACFPDRSAVQCHPQNKAPFQWVRTKLGITLGPVSLKGFACVAAMLYHSEALNWISE